MNKNLLKTQLVEYIKTGDELLFDSNVLDELEDFIMHTCNNWLNSGYNREDILEICLYEIGKGLKHFDPDRGKITTFLAAICNYAMKKHFRNKNAKKRVHEKLINSLNDIYYFGNHSSKPITYEDMCLIHHDPEYTGIDYTEYIFKACENIQYKHSVTMGRHIGYDLKTMFIMHYEGYTQMEICKKCNVSQAQVSRMLKRVKEEIIRLMKKDNIL